MFECRPEAAANSLQYGHDGIDCFLNRCRALSCVAYGRQIHIRCSCAYFRFNEHSSGQEPLSSDCNSFLAVSGTRSKLTELIKTKHPVLMRQHRRRVV